MNEVLALLNEIEIGKENKMTGESEGERNVGMDKEARLDEKEELNATIQKLYGIESKAEDLINYQSGGIQGQSVDKIRKYVEYVNKEASKLNVPFGSEVFEVLEDENAHSLNLTLGLLGFYKNERDSGEWAKKYEQYAKVIEVVNEVKGGGLTQKEEKRLNELQAKEDNDNLNKTEIERLKNKIENVEKERSSKYNIAELEVAALDGLLIRLKLAHEKAGCVISLFITLLFVVIELTPIFFKMMLIRGPYDYMDDNIKDLARAESGIEVIYNYYEDAQGMEAHKVVNHAAELKKKEKLLIIQAQEELNEKIIQNWKNEKLIDIEQNPSKYISEK